MEHRYLLTREDLQERPSWAAALQVWLNQPSREPQDLLECTAGLGHAGQ